MKAPLRNGSDQPLMGLRRHFEHAQQCLHLHIGRRVMRELHRVADRQRGVHQVAVQATDDTEPTLTPATITSVPLAMPAALGKRAVTS